MPETSHDQVAVVRVSPFEKLIERWSVALVPLVPRAVTPNQVTVAGFVAGVLAGLCFFLGGYDRRWLLAAAALVFVHLMADGLDGALARARDRKSDLGFFLDQFLDLGSFLAIAFGIGLSSYARFDIAMVGAVAYTVSLTVMLQWILLRQRYLFPAFGPSDLQAALMAIALLTFWMSGPVAAPFGIALGIADIGFLVGAGVGGIEAVVLAVRLIRELGGPRR